MPDDRPAPEKTERKTTAAPVIVVAVLLLVVLTALYVLSVGPLVAMERAGRLSPQDSAVLQVVYCPLAWLHNNCPPVSTALEFYVGLWAPLFSK